MRQWKTSLLNDYVLDNRGKDEIINQIKELAASYTPEWQFDADNPDIGSCIALLYADEMEELIRRYNLIPERNCIELVNMLNISLKQAYPAHSEVVMNIADNTIPGIKLPKGIKLLADTDEEQGITFETVSNVYLTNSKIKTIFMTCGTTGNVYPIRGSYGKLSYLLNLDEQFNGIEQYNKSFPFRLFDFNRKEYGLHGMLLYHSHLFDVQNNDIVMEIKDGEEIIDEIVAGRFHLKYLTEDGFLRITSYKKAENNKIIFRKNRECLKHKLSGVEYSILLIEPQVPVTRDMTVSEISFSSEGKPELVQYVWDGNKELEVKNFKPFGEVMTMYSELYIGHDDYFTKPGANVKLRFELDFGTKLVSVPRQEEEAQLKVIKRKPRKDIYGAPAEVYADEVVLEYYNGTGWKKLPTRTTISKMFANVKSGICEIDFVCPKDWQPVDSGSEEGHFIRFRLLQADNCFYQPALHNYPVIRDMTVEYSYANCFEAPQKLICFQGSRMRDMTSALATNPQTPVLFRNPYNTTALYWGFDKRLEDGPVSIMVDVEEIEGYSGKNVKFYYSTRDGFERLKLVDNTEGLAKSGTIVFIPPTDMAKMELEGNTGYWIRITNDKDANDDALVKNPRIRSIRINTVEVNNVDSLDEQDYYIDMFGPNMIFALNADNILDVDVWVNEVDVLSEAEMKNLLLEKPTLTKAEYNLRGGIEEFYVCWSEVDNFDNSKADDRHYVIDRMNNTIAFGDGVHVRIPKNTKGIAFKTVVRRCEGKKANVEAGAIKASMNNLMFVSDIYNPKQAYGGMDMETIDEAIRRGATMLGSKNRLITVMDYERETLNFSNCIVQAKAVIGRKKDGERIPGMVTIVLLMEDYKAGSHSFLKMKSRLKHHLLTKCELSINEQYLDVVQPLFVKISAQIWVRLVESDDSFDIQQYLIHSLENYLNPITNPFWEIGRMVSHKQMEMHLNIEKGSALIERVMFSAMYEDEKGRHEVDLKALEGNPYVVVMSGEHKIHFL